MKEQEVSSARRHLVRDALIYTPIFLALLAAWGAALAGVVAAGGGGGIALLVLVTLMVFLVGFQSIQSLRDLLSAPITSEGPVLRKWRRAELLLFPAHFIYVNRNVFRIPSLMYEQIDKGDILVVTHYPHTSTVVAVNRLRRGDAGSGA